MYRIVSQTQSIAYVTLHLEAEASSSFDLTLELVEPVTGNLVPCGTLTESSITKPFDVICGGGDAVEATGLKITGNVQYLKVYEVEIHSLGYTGKHALFT